MPLRREHSAAPALFSALAALVLYAITLGGTYVFDDRSIIQADARISNPQRWLEYWSTDYFNGGPDNLYRPLVSMSYAIQTWVHGNGDGRAWLFHLVNWLLHAAVSGLVAEFVRRIMGWRAGLAAGLIFAAHPIHVEAVANIVGRAELMCGLGIVAALLAALPVPLTAARAVDIWACFVLALLSKEQGMLLPGALLLVWPLRARRAIDPPAQGERVGLLWLVLLLAWTLAAYMAIREAILKFWWDRAFLDWTMNPLIQSRGIDQILMPIALLGRYVALLVAPVRLSLDYGAMVITPSASLTDPYLYIGLISGATWIAGMVWAVARRKWVITFGLGGFALFYGLVSNAAALIGTDFAERLMYIPSFFFALLAGLGLSRLRRKLFIGVLAVVLGLYAIRTVSYAWRWNDRLRLYSYALENHPESIRLHLLLGEELRLRGRFDEAEAVLARGRAMMPDYWRAWHDSAVNAYAAGRMGQARAFIVRAVELRPQVAGMQITYLINTAATRPASGPATRASP